MNAIDQFIEGLTNSMCSVADCPRLGKPCDGCGRRFCVEHQETHDWSEADQIRPHYTVEQPDA